MEKLNALDLFSGIGGISFALREHCKTIAYCEKDDFCQQVLLSSMRKNLIDRAPIWDDIKTFPCDQLSGVDIITAGFPCQDISISGKKFGKDGLRGERSGLFFDLLSIIKRTRPNYVFLENVSNILLHGGREVVREIASLRYRCAWGIFSAASCGAPHLRKRWFLLGRSEAIDSREDSAKLGWEGENSYAHKKTCEKPTKNPLRISGRSLPRNFWAENQPPVCGMAHGIPFWNNRNRALGNSVVPQQVQLAFTTLSEMLDIHQNF